MFGVCGAEAISLGVNTRLAAGFVDTKVETGTSGFITVVAYEMTTAGETSQYLVQLLKSDV